MGFIQKRGNTLISVYSFQVKLPLGTLNFLLLPSEVKVYCLLYCNISVGGNKRGICAYNVCCDSSSNLFLFLLRAVLAEPSLVGLHHIWKLRTSSCAKSCYNALRHLMTKFRGFSIPLKPISSNSLWTRWSARWRCEISTIVCTRELGWIAQT